MRYKLYYSLGVFIVMMSHHVAAQSIQVVSGSYCVGSGSTFSLSGFCTSYSWSVSSGVKGVDYNYSSNTSSGFNVSWLKPMSGIYVKCTYNCSGVGNTAYSSTFSVAANAPSYSVGGGGGFCAGGSGVAITLSGSQTGVSYLLNVNGTPSGGWVTGTGSALSWLNKTVAGTYTVTASTCPQAMSGNAVVTVNALPTIYSIGGGGAYCYGGNGVGITLNGSQVGVNYQLNVNGSNSGSPVSGTGGAIAWNNQTATGTYVVNASNAATGCAIQMSSSTSVNTYNLPAIFGVSGSGGCGVIKVSLNGSQSGTNYQLQINGGNAPVSAKAGTGGSMEWDGLLTSGTYTVLATNSSGCTQLMGGSASMNAMPAQFIVGGGGSYCPGAGGVQVSLAGSESGVNYQLKINGNDSGVAVSGTGNSLVWSNQTGTGTYTVAAVVAATGCAQTMSASALVNTYNTPVTFGVSGGGSFCAGGSGMTINLNGSQSGVDYQLVINGANAPISARSGTGGSLTWSNQITPGTYTVIATDATTHCVQLMGGSAAVIVNSIPMQFAVGGGGCEIANITLGGSEPGVNYQLKVNGTNSGSALAGNGNPLIWSNQSTPGNYTVIATNATTSCFQSMFFSVAVSINPLPVIFSVGGGGGCGNISVTLNGSQAGVNYQLRINGTNAPISAKAGTGGGLSWDNQTTPGSYTVVASNPSTGCQRPMGNSAILNPSPIVYYMGGATSYCLGGTGVNLTLNGSEVGVNYQLKLNGVNSGLPKPGTGVVLTWLTQTAAGTYTTVATNVGTGCNQSMGSSMSVSINPLPVVFGVTGGGGCGGINVSLSGSQAGVNYQLVLNGSDVAISAKPGTGQSIPWNSLSASGIYTVRATDAATGCIQLMGGSAILNPLPVQYTIGGGGSYCLGGSGVNVTLNNSETGVSYQLKFNGVNSGSAKTGTGGTLTWPNQTGVGTYTAGATSTAGCTNTMGGSATVSTNPLPFIFSVGGGGCCGTKNITLNSSQPGVNYQLLRNGSVVPISAIAGTGSGLSWSNMVTGGVYTVSGTISTTSCTQLMGGSATINPSAPVANAGPDKNIDLPLTSLILSGAGSDADGTITSYLWTKISGPMATLSGSNTSNLSLSGLVPGIYQFKLKVTDNYGDFAEDNAIVTVTNNYNYVKLTTVLVKNKQTESDVELASIVNREKDVRITYMDGLGRQQQTIAVQASPLGKDVVQPFLYNEFGNETIKYLPYVSSESDGILKRDALKDPSTTATDPQLKYRSGKQFNFYQSVGGKIVNDQFPYSESVIETSPLNRVLKQGAEGAAWQPQGNNAYSFTDNTIKIRYEGNLPTEVLMWKYVNPAPGSPLGTVVLDNMVYYKPNELYKKRIKDEHNNESLEFVDKDGNTILKKNQLDGTTYAQTYYVYDNLNNLVCVIQPEGTRLVLSRLAITWSSKTGVTAGTDNSLTKSAASGYGNGAATSITTTETLAANTDGWVETTAAETDKSRMIGLAASNVNNGTNIQYAIELRNDGKVMVWENNVSIADLGSYSSGTVVRIARENSQINYYVDGQLKRTSSTPTSGALIVDAALNENGSTLKSVYISFTVNSSMPQLLTSFGFQYTYDSRGRVSHKQVCGAAPVYLVYDGRDRLVLSQDGVQRSATTQYWTFTKYDELNRPILTGIKDTTVALTQAEMQNVVNTHFAKPSSKWSESYIGNVQDNFHGYSNKAYPVFSGGASTDVNANKYLTITYYDSYSFLSLWPNTYTYLNEGLSEMANGITYTQPTTESLLVKGQITGTKIKVLDGGLTGAGAWIRGVNYYDDKNRLVQSIIDNITGGADRSTIVLDFTGKVLKNKTSHSILWKDLAGVEAGPTGLSRTLTGNGWIAGAASVDVLPAGVNGWVEFEVSETNNQRMIGLSSENKDAGNNNMEFAVKLNSGNYNVIEGSSDLGSKTTVAAGNIIRIERTGSTVKYLKNGVVVYTSLKSSNTPLMVDASLNEFGATLSNVKFSFKNATPRSITRRFEYDHVGRPMKIWHKVDAQAEVLLSSNSYNELGQLVDKKLHSTVVTASDAKQSIDYRYNIRGWLTKINESDIDVGKNDASNAGEARDYYGMEIGYNADIGMANSSMYNGNISAIKWSKNQGLGTSKENAYVYSYDPMNRITAAAFKEKATSWNALANEGFSESNYTYDLNGNILTLIRYDQRGSTAPLDNLTMFYSYGSSASQTNKLLKVTDTGDANGGFLDGATATTEYGYNENGSMTFDSNKEIKSPISYNYLNLPELLTRGTSNTIRNIYDATGKKLSQVVSYNTSKKRTDYIGEYQYENSVLQSISTEEGRIVLSNEVLAYQNAGDNDIGFTTTSTASITPVMQNTDQTYLKVISSGTTARTGITNVVTIGVVSGERYKIRAKGYRDKGTSATSNPVYLLVQFNGVDKDFPGATLGSALTSEAWTEQIVTIPASVNTLQAGIIWNTAVTAGELFYLNDFEVIKLNANDSPEYQYMLKDHLGNVRVTFTTKATEDLFTATLEDNAQSVEENQFSHYTRLTNDLYDHTDAGAVYDKVQLLNGGNNSQVGLTKSLSVMPGDIITAEVYAKYFGTTGPSGNINAFASALLSAFGLPNPAVGEIGTASSAINNYGAFIAAGNNPGNNGWPKGFLNILVFDKNYNLVDLAFQQLDGTYVQSGAVKAPHQLLSKQVVITEPGYVYIYISNEGNVQQDVYFDDFKISHMKSPMISTSDYYAFGLSFNEYVRENSILNNYKYNGKELQTDLSLSWLDYGARMYMPELGRWFGVDKKAEKYHKFTPYMYAANNPLIFIDPDGMDLIKVTVPTNADGTKTQQLRVDSKIARQFYDFAKAANKEFGLTINNAFRSQAKQDAMHADWVKNPEKYNAEPALSSNHTGGFALDFNFKSIGIKKKNKDDKDSKDKIRKINELAAQYGFSPIDNDLGHYASDATEHGYESRQEARDVNDQYSKDHTEAETPEYNATREDKIMSLINQYQESSRRTKNLMQRIEAEVDRIQKLLTQKNE